MEVKKRDTEKPNLKVMKFKNNLQLYIKYNYKFRNNKNLNIEQNLEIQGTLSKKATILQLTPL